MIQKINDSTINNDENNIISELEKNINSIAKTNISDNNIQFDDFIKKYNSEGNKNIYISETNELISKLKSLGFNNQKLTELQNLNNSEFNTNKQNLYDSFTKFNNNNQFIEGITNTIKFINKMTNKLSDLFIKITSKIKSMIQEYFIDITSNENAITVIIDIATKLKIKIRNPDPDNLFKPQKKINKKFFQMSFINKYLQNPLEFNVSLGSESYTKENILKLKYKDIKKFEQITKDILLFCTSKESKDINNISNIESNVNNLLYKIV
jgi:hypothetical protein